MEIITEANLVNWRYINKTFVDEQRHFLHVFGRARAPREKFRSIFHQKNNEYDAR